MVVDSAVPCAFSRRQERLVVGVFASTVCTANGVPHPSSGFAVLGFPRSCTRLLCIRAGVPPKLMFESAYDTRSRSLPRGQWAPTSQRRVVWWSLLLLAETFCSHPCSRKPAPNTSSTASGRCSRHRDALKKVLCSPTRSSRAAPVAPDKKSSRLTILCPLSP